MRAIIAINFVGALVLALDAFVRHINVLAEPFQAYGTYILIVGVAGAPLVFAARIFIFGCLRRRSWN
ncbi:MAG: hypothetical protein WDM79_19460 [Terricaulis sp.]